jgi:hypothetical protein
MEVDEDGRVKKRGLWVRYMEIIGSVDVCVCSAYNTEKTNDGGSY